MTSDSTPNSTPSASKISSLRSPFNFPDGLGAETNMKRSRWSESSSNNFTTFSNLATSVNMEDALSSATTIARPMFKKPVLKKNDRASMIGARAPCSSFFPEDKGMIAGTVAVSSGLKEVPHFCSTQAYQKDKEYSSQITGLKSRVYVSETIVGKVRERLPVVENLVKEQEREITSLTGLAKEQGDMIMEQRDAIKEQKLMIENLEKLVIGDHRKKAVVTVAERKVHNPFKKEESMVAPVGIPEMKLLKRVKKQELQDLCASNGIAFVANETRADLIEKLAELL